MLGGLHDAYRATVTEQGEPRRRAAQTLLVILGNRDAAALARHVASSGVSVPQDRLSAVMADASVVAEQTLSGAPTGSVAFSHRLNLDWLSEMVLATRCYRDEIMAGAKALSPGHTTPARTSKESRQTGTDPASRNWLVLVATGLALALVVGGYRLSTSLFMRARRVERLPRFPISLPLELTFIDAEGQERTARVEALDISLGGLKLSWRDPPPPGARATLSLFGADRIGHVAWSNAFYAGVVLEVPLTRQELSSLTGRNKPGQKRKTAPEGAA